MNLPLPALLAVGAVFAAPVPSPSPAVAPSPDPTAFHAVTMEPGPEWDLTRSVREQPGIREHGEYMSSLSADGRIALGGPFMEGEPPSRATGAIVIYATGDAAEARRWAEADPGVKGGLFTIRSVRRFVVATGAWRPWAATR